MARRYRTTAWRRALNRFTAAAARRGRGPRQIRLLTVEGRRSGEPHTTPVILVEAQGERWLVAPYGPVAWVQNLRAAGRARLERAGRTEVVGAVEVGPDEAASILRRYVVDTPITRPYFDASVDSPLEAFAAEAGRHPVFRLVPPPGEGG